MWAISDVIKELHDQKVGIWPNLRFLWSLKTFDLKYFKALMFENKQIHK